ncbi:MAG TPA: ABC transporter permease [Thermomicrobiales bacterium]|nr:ABC transporter permease [Thermomicrobiales bacterium]
MVAALCRLLLRYAVLGVAVVLLNFLIPRLLPGDPLSFGSGEGTGPAVPLSGAAKAELQAYYHLDEPLSRQLVAYLGDLARGDLGHSIERPAPVRDLILDRLPWTAGLLSVSLLLATVTGTALGLLAGWAPGRRLDRLLVSVTGALAAIPEFLVAIGFLLVFAVGFGWFPLFGGESVFADYGDGRTGAVRRASNIATHLILPAATLVVVGVSAFVLLARDTAAGLRHAPWIVVARAKGLPARQVAWRHVLPNMALPILSFFGLRFGALLGGALVVERVFGVPGLGLLAYQALRARDYPLLQALFLLSSLAMLVANLAVDVISLRLLARRGVLHG